MSHDTLIPLWPGMEYHSHQVVGIKWMLAHEIDGTTVETAHGREHIYGGIQCDDMGLGKTIQTAAVMQNNPLPRTLLVAPLAMLDTWAGVLERAGFTVMRAAAGSVWAGKVIRSRPSVFIAGYERLVASPSLARAGFDRIILDEAHKIRNPDSEAARTMRKISAPIRWALTGTPIVNKRQDIVSLMAFIGVPCGALYRWKDDYEDLLPELMIHRSMEEMRPVLDAAPPVPVMNEITLDFATEEEAEFYRGIQGTLESKLAAFKHDLLTPQQRFLLLLRLRQISVHPQVYISAKRRENRAYRREDWTGVPTKVAALKGLVDEGVEAGHRYLVFCQFVEEMSLIGAELRTGGHAVACYHGGMSQKERSAALGAGADVLLMQIQAGGVGLNLQEYDRCVFMSPWWTAALMDQAIARTVRMGQKAEVHVIHLRLAEEASLNIDALIAEKAEQKREILEDILAMRADVCCEADRESSCEADSD